MTTALWILAFALMLVGVLGLVLPLLPGVPLVFAGMLLAAAIEDFERISWITITVLGVLTLIAVIGEFAASTLGTKRAGASPRAVWGAFLGTVIGLFFGLPGLLLGPFIGAVAGELSVHGRLDRAREVGIATWIGLLIGTIAKIAITFAMLGVFAFAYFID